MGSNFIKDAFLITEKKTVPSPLANQTDLVGIETTRNPPWSAVAFSQWHYGQPATTFIEDQPITRGNFNKTVVEGLITAGDLRLLQDNYNLNNFAATHSLVLIVDSLNMQNALLGLLPEDKHEGCQLWTNDARTRAKWRSTRYMSETPQSMALSEGMPQGSFIHAASRGEDCRSLRSSMNDLHRRNAGAMNVPHFDLNKQTNTNTWRLAA